MHSDNLRKQFGPISKLFHALIVFIFRYFFFGGGGGVGVGGGGSCYFLKRYLEDIKACKIAQHAELKIDSAVCFHKDILMI